MSTDGKKSKQARLAGECPIRATVDVIGGRWKPMLLFYLLEGEKRFSEFRREIPEINQRMLTLQLRELEQHGIVHRKVFAEVPPKVIYSLTDLGKTLGPALRALESWGSRHLRR